MWLPVHRALPNQDTLPPLHPLQMTAFLHRTGNVDRAWNMKKMTNLIHLLNIAWRPRSLFLIFHFQRVQTDKCVFPRIQGTRSFLTLFLYHSIGLSGCPILSKWTPNLSIRTLTLDQNTRRTSWAAPT